MQPVAAQWRHWVRRAALIGCAGLLIPLAGCLALQDSCKDCQECTDAGLRCEDDCDRMGLCVGTCRYVRCLDEKVTVHDAIRRANAAMRYDYAVAPSMDTRRGYRAAFIDVALGASGEIPPVPPQRYWGVCYRTPEGHARAQDWFAGYSMGASRALASCRSLYNDVPSSGTTRFAEDQTSIMKLDEGGWTAPANW